MVKVSNIDFCPYAIPTTDPPGQGVEKPRSLYMQTGL